MTVVVDFDGTLAEYDGYKGPGVYGPPIPAALETLAELRRQGYFIHIFTSRSWIEWESLKAYLDLHQVPHDMITCGKPAGLVYIDDRSSGRGGDWAQVRKDLNLAPREGG